MKSIDCQDGIIHATLQGDVNTKVWSEVFRKALEFSDVHRSKALLIDLRLARIPLNVIDVYNLPPVLQHVGLSRQYGLAWIMKERNRELDFYEVVFLNQGFTTKVFTDVEDAKSWLKKVN